MKKNINTLLQEALDVCEDLNIEVRTILDISWNKRLKAVWGRCTQTKSGYKIELNTILGEDCVSWEDAMNTVIHEVLHCHENRFCHTGEWKRCAELVNRKYPIYHISRCTSAEEKGIAAETISTSFKYAVVCLNCGLTVKYKRSGKIVKLIKSESHSCFCGKCNSTALQLIEF